MPLNEHQNASAPLARLVIDLDAVAWNYLFMKNRLTTGADCAAVVKADAYGLGAVPVSQALFDQGCRHFFVAQAEEGLIVHDALPAADRPGHDRAIYVLDGPRGISMDDMVQAGLIPVLNTMADVQLWAETAAHVQKKLPAVLHVDTGMNRLGFSADDLTSLTSGTGKAWLAQLDIRYVMSHLACADVPDHAMNAEQLLTFKTALQQLGRTYRASFANSAGILLGADYHFDLARPGCSLYGINPYGNSLPNMMRGVVRFETQILQIRDVAASETIGYGAGYAASRPMRVATLAIGYADGFSRSLQQKGHVHVQGHACAVIGRVSMDSIMIDITDVTAPVTEGDWAEVIGAHQKVDDIAAQDNTIGYEILTRLGKRIRRTYQQNMAK